MSTTQDVQSTVVRTERGLTIAGTRTTLYNVMDSLKADWPPKLIRDWLDLTEAQIQGAMAYIETHRDEVEAEYQLVLPQAEECRRYWEQRKQARLAQIATQSPDPEKEWLRAKINARKAELGMI